uniref:Uncharacterized protein n=1 Tax=Parascaris univalens TaxID=6257 RepID=A0A915AC25_PARUN
MANIVLGASQQWCITSLFRYCIVLVDSHNLAYLSQ